MKLAIFGAVVAAAGLAFGINGLIFSGALWLASGLLITWSLAARGQESESTTSGLTIQDESEVGRIERSPVGEAPGTWPGFALMLAIGLGSLAIGVFEVGFTGGDEGFRWLPIVVGILLILLTLISLPARLGWLEPAALAAKMEAAKSSQIETDSPSPAGGGRGVEPKARLEQLEELRRANLITPGEYEEQRRRILGSI